MLTLERLKRLVRYHPETGFITRLTDTARSKSGALAGYIDANGYHCLDIDGHPYKGHRIAWFYMTGVMPTIFVDHINGDRSDNRFSNLRLATNSQNQINRSRPKNNSSGLKGVSFQATRKKWIAMITINRKAINLGRYDTKEAAALAYDTAAQNAFGEFVPGAARQQEITGPSKVGAGLIDHPDITEALLRSLFSYDPEEGRFRRTTSRQGQAKAGDLAGSLEYTGYRAIKIYGKRYREHHLAWLYVYGYLPKGEIDHINGDPSDNRISNLRECTSTQNLQNRRVQTRARTGLKGVSYDDRCTRKYYARIKVDDRVIHLGNFLNAEDASAAYNEAAKLHFGEFAKAGDSKT